MKQLKRLIKLQKTDQIEWRIEFFFRYTGSFYMVTIERDIDECWGNGKQYRHPIPQWEASAPKLKDAIKSAITYYHETIPNNL